MNKNLKRILSLTLSLMMTLGLLSTTALAYEDDDYYDDGPSIDTVEYWVQYKEDAKQHRTWAKADLTECNQNLKTADAERDAIRNQLRNALAQEDRLQAQLAEMEETAKQTGYPVPDWYYEMMENLSQSIANLRTQLNEANVKVGEAKAAKTDTVQKCSRTFRAAGGTLYAGKWASSCGPAGRSSPGGGPGNPGEQLQRQYPLGNSPFYQQGAPGKRPR